MLENSTAQDRIEEESEDTVTTGYLARDYEEEPIEEAPSLPQAADV